MNNDLIDFFKKYIQKTDFNYDYEKLFTKDVEYLFSKDKDNGDVTYHVYGANNNNIFLCICLPLDVICRRNYWAYLEQGYKPIDELNDVLENYSFIEFDIIDVFRTSNMLSVDDYNSMLFDLCTKDDIIQYINHRFNS